MNEFWDIVLGLCMIILFIALLGLLIFIPFAVIGFGLSFIVWATCLPLSFCQESFMRIRTIDELILEFALLIEDVVDTGELDEIDIAEAFEVALDEVFGNSDE